MCILIQMEDNLQKDHHVVKDLQQVIETMNIIIICLLSY